MVTKVSDRGQVSVPSDVRRELGIGPGVSIKWDLLADGTARVTVMRSNADGGAKNLLGFAKRFRETRSTDEWFK